ncbi:Tyrosine-protein kinase ITK/TSK [Liparis tanakae]|uniref:Tyrosine-protein kinase ITK/TSK n=1 Tax=Liparis tanakae TaxID=230148 RepID=A0A4Z2GFN3_9TELE|nr:Tyrosine-protein kinase ITK/TSK [Liparis tanakae]
MLPRLILKETLIKKSQQKKRISPCNYKERLFVLDTQDLKYSDCRPGIFYNHFYLYIFAPDSDCRQRWVSALKEATKRNNLVAEYHPDFWRDGKWRCCQQTEKLAAGCQAYGPVASVIDGLDRLKKENAGARDGIRFLESEFRKGNRYIRCQKESGRSVDRDKVKRQDMEAW